MAGRSRFATRFHRCSMGSNGLVRVRLGRAGTRQAEGGGGCGPPRWAARALSRRQCRHNNPLEHGIVQRKHRQGREDDGHSPSTSPLSTPDGPGDLGAQALRVDSYVNLGVRQPSGPPRVHAHDRALARHPAARKAANLCIQPPNTKQMALQKCSDARAGATHCRASCWHFTAPAFPGGAPSSARTAPPPTRNVKGVSYLSLRAL